MQLAQIETAITAGNAASGWISDQGLATFLLIAGLVFTGILLWKAGRWMGYTGNRLADAGIKHLDKLGEHMEVHDENMRSINQSMSQTNTAVLAMNERLSRAEEHQEMVTSALKDLAKCRS